MGWRLEAGGWGQNAPQSRAARLRARKFELSKLSMSARRFEVLSLAPASSLQPPARLHGVQL